MKILGIDLYLDFFNRQLENMKLPTMKMCMWWPVYWMLFLCCSITEVAGEKIVFVSDRSGNKDIYTMASDGSDLRQLTHSQGNDTWPSWSPDGKRIAFVSNREGTPNLFVMNEDGGHMTRLCTLVHAGGFPSWSPDGRKIAFNSIIDDFAS